MKKFFILLTFGLVLSGCGLVRKMDIQQGNILTQERVSQLRTGMTKPQVQAIMGTPVLLNTFNDGRIDYVYTYQPGNGSMTEKHLVLYFNRSGILQNIRAY